MLRAQMEKVDNIQEQIIEIKTQIQKEVLEIKNTLVKKNYL